MINLYNEYKGKRALDILLSSIIIIMIAPLLLISLFLVWIYDRKPPIYKAERVGLGNLEFTMFKVRTMIVDADNNGVNSTTLADERITPIGRYIRRFKIDELLQFFNVFKGDMSIVGPRPNTRSAGVDLYTHSEMDLLTVRPGITDFSSIVFSDEGAILGDSSHPDETYNRLIRPWKSRLGLHYIRVMSPSIDLKLIWLTMLAIFSKQKSLTKLSELLVRTGAEKRLIEVCERKLPLVPCLPPGQTDTHNVEEIINIRSELESAL